MAKIIGIPTQLTEDQVQIVDILKETLAQALEGKINTIGIIACFDNGFASVMGGTMAGALNMGCDDLKRKILDAVTKGTQERQTRRSSILQPMQ